MKIKYSIIPAITRVAALVAFSILSLPLAAHSETRKGAVEISPFVGYNFFQNRQNLDDGIVYGARLGYNLHDHLSIEAAFDYIRTHVDDKSEDWTRKGQFTSPIDRERAVMYHLDLLYIFTPEKRLNPFVVAGIGAANYSPSINNRNMTALNYGAGLKYWLSDNLALRFDLRDNVIYHEQINNVEATLGIVFAFGGESKKPVVRNEPKSEPKVIPPPAPQPKPVVVEKAPVAAPVPVAKAPAPPAAPAPVEKAAVPPPAPKPVAVVAPAPKPAVAPAPVPPPVVVVAPVPKPAEKVVILVSEPKKVEEVVKAAVVEPKLIILAFEDIHFDFDASSLKPESKLALKRNLQILKDNGKTHVRIAGYTSAAGTEEYNQKLSERRAAAVRDYLVNEGLVSSDRITQIGYGETDPEKFEAAPKDMYSEAAKANMRVLFEIALK